PCCLSRAALRSRAVRPASPLEILMRCPNCRHENEEGANFCEECAAPLARACAKCGHRLSPTAKFCPEDAHPTGVLPEALPAARSTAPSRREDPHLKPNFNSTRDKSVSAQALTRARAALSTTLWRSALCLGRLGLGDFADVGWQRDTDRLEDMADVAGNWCAQ